MQSALVRALLSVFACVFVSACYEVRGDIINQREAVSVPGLAGFYRVTGAPIEDIPDGADPWHFRISEIEGTNDYRVHYAGREFPDLRGFPDLLMRAVPIADGLYLASFQPTKFALVESQWETRLFRGRAVPRFIMVRYVSELAFLAVMRFDKEGLQILKHNSAWHDLRRNDILHGLEMQRFPPYLIAPNVAGEKAAIMQFAISHATDENPNILADLRLMPYPIEGFLCSANCDRH